MNAEETFQLITSGGIYSDIRDHLPRLREAARGNVFEIGVRGGVSTAALLVGIHEHGGHLWSLDIINYAHHFDDPNWSFIHGHSVHDAPRVLEQLPKYLDVLFVDSDHTAETTRYELMSYAPLVKKDGGVILMHDTDLDGAGVRKALEDYAHSIKKIPIFHTGSFGLGELRP